MADLKRALAAAGRSRRRRRRPARFPQAFQDEVAPAASRSLATRAARGRCRAYLVERLLLDSTGYLEGALLDGHGDDAIAATAGRRARAGWPRPAARCRPSKRWPATAGWAEVLTGVVTRPPQRVVTRGDRIDRVLTHGSGARSFSSC